MAEPVLVGWSGENFLVFTPFSIDEVADVLGLPLRDALLARQTGALRTSIAGRDDPFGRLRLSSVWDIVEFEMLLRAGWPLGIGRTMHIFISDLCDDLASHLEQNTNAPGDQRIDVKLSRYTDHADACLASHLQEVAPLVLQQLLVRLHARAEMPLCGKAQVGVCVSCRTISPASNRPLK